MPIPIWYTFGNHMHWVDMQWLWGYHVLPGSVRDMLHFCRETGAKGNVNFDGIGYEKLASENPEALWELREAVQVGTVEVVGASYGQPYGLFHGGESNIRQRIYGARAVMRLLGVRPKTFWEEEFDFFPQLPQMLAGVGFEYASLFFQWTWHTPEIPKEEAPVVWWEGVDGSRLLTATRNHLNLHQWPEDVEILMDQLAEGTAENQIIQQWLELMPSPDWMCRSEILLPKTKELLSDPRFEFKFGTLSEAIRGGSAPLPVSSTVPVKRYLMDEVWHGMSLGKNADRAPRQSHYSERCLLQVESLQAMLGLFGRPYDNWDVYPVWELEEAWRSLLAAQHHDNHECEGLCGHVAEPQYDAVHAITKGGQRGLEHLARRLNLADGETLLYNSLGWARQIGHEGFFGTGVFTVPALGYRVIQAAELKPETTEWLIVGQIATFDRGEFSVRIDLDARNLELRIGDSRRLLSLPELRWTKDGHEVRSQEPLLFGQCDERSLKIGWERQSNCVLYLTVPLAIDALDLTAQIDHSSEDFAQSTADDWWPDAGMNAGFQCVWEFGEAWDSLRSDTPYAVSEVKPSGPWQRKYPTGDWMTSPQWFETIENAFTSLSLVDVLFEGNEGLLILHDGSQQWFGEGKQLRNLLSMRDPWDEGRAKPGARTRYRFIPHQQLSDASRWKLGRELFGTNLYPDVLSQAWNGTGEKFEHSLPEEISSVSCAADNVCVTAFYREAEDYSSRDLPAYAGTGVGHPYVLRLVEFDGIETLAEISVAGTVASAVRTNLLGERLNELEVTPKPGHSSTTFTVGLRPYEISTLYLDIIEGRKQTRDLDAARNVWATVHRLEDE